MPLVPPSPPPPIAEKAYSSECASAEYPKGAQKTIEEYNKMLDQYLEGKDPIDI